MDTALRSLTPVALALLLAFSTAGTAQQQAGSQAPPAASEPEQQPREGEEQQPVFRTGIHFVQVDAIVTDRGGNPVLDLEPADFEVFEDGERQEVETFRLVRIDGIPDPDEGPPRDIRSLADQEREMARDDVRVFAILLDDYHVRLGASMRVREPLARFIRQQIAPTDLVAIMYPLTPVSDLLFTRNHESIASAIEQFEGRKFNYQPRNPFEDRYAFYPAAVVERIRNEVTMSALKALVTHLGGLREGRKSVIFVSEGFTARLPAQLRDPIAALPGFRNPARGTTDPMEGDMRSDSATFFSTVDLMNDLRQVYAAANRANTAIYALDPRGLAGFEYDINEAVGVETDRGALTATMDTLRVLAQQTDGRAILNQNDLDSGLRQIIRDSSAYYLLGYNSSQAPTDGRFHEIRVRVNRPGVQVRARRGYWALTAEETVASLTPRAGPPPAVTEALASIVGPARGHAVRTWVGTSRADSGRTQVTFVWEPVPPVPGQRTDPPARVSLTAIGRAGNTWYRGEVPDGGAAGGDAPVNGPSRVSFEADPGPLQLRLAVEGTHGQVLDSDTRELEVPDFTRVELSVSTPQIFRAQNALEFRNLRSGGDAAPAATRDFRRTDRLLIRFDAYAPGGERAAVTAQLLNREGTPMSDVPVQAAEPAGHQVDLPLAGLAAGEYLLEIAAAAGGEAVKELVAFRVTS